MAVTVVLNLALSTTTTCVSQLCACYVYICFKQFIHIYTVVIVITTHFVVKKIQRLFYETSMNSMKQFYETAVKQSLKTLLSTNSVLPLE
jgi:hypothetical protein